MAAKGKLNTKWLVIGLVIILVAVGGYVTYTRLGDTSDDPVVTLGTPNPLSAIPAPEAAIPLSEEAQEVLGTIAILRNLNLDTEFFNDERFKSLRATPIVIPDPVDPRRRILRFFSPPQPTEKE